MAHDIEANYIKDYWNEDRQCRLCTSFDCSKEKCACKELDQAVGPNDYCDFFSLAD
jgi:hypothetical protein